MTNFEVNGVKYMAIEGTPEDLALGGFWEVIGLVKDLTIEQRVPITGKTLSHHYNSVKGVDGVEFDVFDNSGEEYVWEMFLVSNKISDNHLIIKQL